MDRIVGIVGLGIMGGAIARNLVERGWTVIGFDVDEGKKAEAKAAGVTLAASAADVAHRAPILFTSLPSPKIVVAVAEEIAASGAPKRIVAEFSTLALADKMKFKAILEKAGHVALDCPLSGTGAQAAVRDLIVYASGDTAAIKACVPAFEDFSKQNADLGAYGNGSKLKFVANHLVAIHNVASAEAMVLAKKAGLDVDQVVALVGPGAGGSRMFQMRAPMMAANVYEPPTMRCSTWQKDMQVIGDFAKEMGVPTPLFTRTEAIYEKTLEMGLGDMDTAAVCVVLEAEAGLRK
jgi:3-hydroxyisobutyrate dehydrogenase-like beta-hydroxyacid dehydrogenase